MRRIGINKFIILLIGKSGTGKTTVAQKLYEKYGMKSIESYTTRPPRYEGETGHIFVTDKEYESMKDDMVAYTVFNGYKYWATNKQVENADIYIIDPAGVEYFRDHYKGNKKIITVELLAQKKVRYKRMRGRGDSWRQAKKRLRHDKLAFKNTSPMLTVNANIDDIDMVVDRVLVSTGIQAAMMRVKDE